jgi:hypothetical protein
LSNKDIKNNNLIKNNFATASDEREQKAKLIESMLFELGMSKQELVDMLKSILFPDKDRQAEIDIIETEIFLGLKADDKEQSYDLDSKIDSEADQDSQTIGKETQEEKKQHISKALSLESLKKLIENIRLVVNLQKFDKLGLKPNLAKITSILNVGNITSLNKNGSLVSDGRNLMMSRNQLSDLNDYLSSEIMKHNAQKANSTFLARSFDKAKDFVNKATSKLKDTIHVLDYQADMLRFQQNLQRLESASKSLNRLEDAIKEKVPGLRRISYRDNEIRANIEGVDREVNLEKYLKNNGMMTADLQKLLNQAGSSGRELLKMLEDFKQKYNLQDEKLKFSKSGKLYVELELQDTKKNVHVADYLSDIQKLEKSQQKYAKNKADDDYNERKKVKEELEEMEQEQQIERLKNKGKEGGDKSQSKAQSKSQEVKSDLQKLDAIKDNAARINQDKKAGNKASSSQRARDLDMPDNTESDQDLDVEPGQEKEGQVVSESGEVMKSSDKEKAEAVKTKESLVKQDIVADKARLINDMKEVKSLMKSGMKDMDKAMQNKDLMNEIKKEMMKDKMLNK